MNSYFSIKDTNNFEFGDEDFVIELGPLKVREGSFFGNLIEDFKKDEKVKCQ